MHEPVYAEQGFILRRGIEKNFGGKNEEE